MKHDSYADLTARQLAFTIGGMILTLLLAAMDQTIIGTAMPRVTASLNGFDRYPWVTTVYLLTSTVAVPVFAKISDLYGRKWLYLSGAVLFIVASGLCGLAGNLPLPLDGMNQLILARGLQGIGGGAITGLTFTIVGDLFTPKDRGRYQGVFGAVFGLASIVGPVAGGWITDHYSWRWTFYVNFPIGIVAVAMLYFTFPYVKPHGTRKVIDWAGIAAMIAWIVPLLLALSTVNDRGWTDPRVLTLLIWAAVALAAFIIIERRAIEPLLPPSLFKVKSFRLSIVSVFCLGVGLFGMFLYLPLYLQAVLGMSAQASGSLFTPMIFAMIGASIVSGQIVSRTGRYKAVAVTGSTLSAAGMLMLAFLGSEVTTAALITDLVVVGLGFGCVQPIFNLVIQNSAPRDQMGAATASSQFFRSIGSTIGVAVFGTVLLGIYHRGVGAAMSPAAQSSIALIHDSPAMRASLGDGMHVIFVSAGAVMAVTLVLTLFLPEVPLRAHHHAPASE
jgi:EmrB/QacA subfamily drug resistance transporter